VVCIWDQYNQPNVSDNTILVELATGDSGFVISAAPSTTPIDNYVDTSVPPVTSCPAVPAWQIQMTNATLASWIAGDPYGKETSTRYMLPRGFEFQVFSGGTPTLDQRRIIFRPDGTVQTVTPITLVVEEKLKGKIISFTITPTGQISQN
jgi:hypothetical protein